MTVMARIAKIAHCSGLVLFGSCFITDIGGILSYKISWKFGLNPLLKYKGFNTNR